MAHGARKLPGREEVPDMLDRGARESLNEEPDVSLPNRHQSSRKISSASTQ